MGRTTLNGDNYNMADSTLEMRITQLVLKKATQFQLLDLRNMTGLKRILSHYLPLPTDVRFKTLIHRCIIF